MTTITITISGAPKSGKTTLAQFVKEALSNYGFRIVSFEDDAAPRRLTPALTNNTVIILKTEVTDNG